MKLTERCCWGLGCETTFYVLYKKNERLHKRVLRRRSEERVSGLPCKPRNGSISTHTHTYTHTHTHTSMTHRSVGQLFPVRPVPPRDF
jgi:hypothetical protein